MTTANAIFIFGLMFLGCGLMLIGYLFRRPAIAIVSSIAWLIFGFHSRTLSLALWDIFYVMFIMGVCLFFAAFIEGIILRPKVADMEPEEDMWDREVEDYIDRRTKWKERMSKIMDASKREKEEPYWSRRN